MASPIGCCSLKSLRAVGVVQPFRAGLDPGNSCHSRRIERKPKNMSLTTPKLLGKLPSPKRALKIRCSPNQNENGREVFQLSGTSFLPSTTLRRLRACAAQAPKKARSQRHLKQRPWPFQSVGHFSATTQPRKDGRHAATKKHASL